MTRFHRGLVVGKFAPLHLGHEHLIATARSRCDQLFILSYANPELPGCAPERRAGWHAARFPDLRSLVITPAWLAANAPDLTLPLDTATDETHRHFLGQLLRALQYTPDALFTSEAYGPGAAAALSRVLAAAVAHVAVDPQRTNIPISGTRLRADIHGHRHYLAAEVYADFVERVALLGGESSGKSTLTLALADHFATNAVAEYGRELWEQKAGHLDLADLLAIADEHIRREDAACLRANRFVFCDTTPLTTRFYADVLFAHVPPRLAALSSRAYHHTFLCAPDFPFVQDGTRQDAAFRARGHAFYLHELTAAAVPFHELQGPLRTRLHQAAAHLLAHNPTPAAALFSRR